MTAKSNGMKTRNFWISEDLDEWLGEDAQRHRLSRSAYLRAVLDTVREYRAKGEDFGADFLSRADAPMALTDAPTLEAVGALASETRAGFETIAAEIRAGFERVEQAQTPPERPRGWLRWFRRK